jgi:hypothetical protein
VRLGRGVPEPLYLHLAAIRRGEPTGRIPSVEPLARPEQSAPQPPVIEDVADSGGAIWVQARTRDEAVACRRCLFSSYRGRSGNSATRAVPTCLSVISPRAAPKATGCTYHPTAQPGSAPPASETPSSPSPFSKRAPATRPPRGPGHRGRHGPARQDHYRDLIERYRFLSPGGQVFLVDGLCGRENQERARDRTG